MALMPEASAGVTLWELAMWCGVDETLRVSLGKKTKGELQLLQGEWRRKSK
jgi:hypothetical protein